MFELCELSGVLAPLHICSPHAIGSTLVLEVAEDAAEPARRLRRTDALFSPRQMVGPESSCNAAPQCCNGSAIPAELDRISDGVLATESELRVLRVLLVSPFLGELAHSPLDERSRPLPDSIVRHIVCRSPSPLALGVGSFSVTATSGVII